MPFIFIINIMHRKFLTNLFFLLGLNLIVKPFWIFGIDRTVQNVVGGQVYGLYFAIFNFTVIFNTILDFGINNFNNKNVASSSSFLPTNFSGIFSLKILLAFVYFVVVFVIGLIVGYSRSVLGMLMWMAFNQFLSCFILYLRSNVSGLLMFKTDSILSVIDRVVMIVCCGILLWGGVTEKPFQIEWFIACQTFAYLLTIAIALPIVLKKVKLHFPTWSPSLFKKILWQSLPFALLALLTSLHNRTDAVLLERILPANSGEIQSGIYASAFRLLDAATMIAYLFSVILLPLFAHLLQKKENVLPLIKTAFSLMFVYGILVATISWFFAPELMNFLSKHQTNISILVFKLLMIVIVPLSATYIFGTLLTAMGEMKKLNIIAAIAVSLNFSLNFLLIPHFKAVGAALASLCTQLFLIIAEVLIVKRLFKQHIPWKYLLQLFLFVGLTIISTYGISLLHWNWKINCMLAVSCIGLISFAVQLFSVKELKKNLKKDIVPTEE